MYFFSYSIDLNKLFPYECTVVIPPGVLFPFGRFFWLHWWGC